MPSRIKRPAPPLAFVRQHGTRLLADVLDAQPQPEEDDGNTPNSAAA
jgi:hypothetical protein